MDHGNHGGDSAVACKISVSFGMSRASASPARANKEQMLWNWYTIDACFLSRSWHITSHGAFAATCIGVVLLVVLLEALRRIGKEYDEHIQRDFAARLALIAGSPIEPLSASSADGTSPAPATCPAAANATEAVAPQTVTFRATPLQQFTRAVIHAATFGVAYIVMLLAMYYNGYIIISILIGALLGKFLCDWMTRTVVVGGTGAVKSGNRASGIEEPTVCCG
jgi:copper transporter 1